MLSISIVAVLLLLLSSFLALWASPAIRFEIQFQFQINAYAKNHLYVTYVLHHRCRVSGVEWRLQQSAPIVRLLCSTTICRLCMIAGCRHTHTHSLTHSMHNYAGFYVANTYACTMYVCVGVCICAAVGKWFVGNGEPDIDGSLNWLHRTSANIVDLWTFAIGAANARRPASKWRADATAETCYMWQIGKTTNFADQCHWLWELNRSRWNSFDLCLRDLPKK